MSEDGALAQAAFDAKRRLEDRCDATGVTVEIDGVCYSVRDWSVRGLALEGYAQAQTRGDRLRATVTAPELDDTEVAFETGLFVVRHSDEDKVLAAVYVDYGREAAVLLDRLFPFD